MSNYTPYDAPRIYEFMEATQGWTQLDFCAFMLHSWAMNYSTTPRSIKGFREKNYART